nr:reverse transcriptase domain-containing protein [Tanacetum cinerariifolium]
MSAMANTIPLVTTVTKPATNLRDADATLRVNIHDFCEEYYEDILPIIMDKVHRDKRKESAFDRLSDTYSPSTTKSRPRGTDSRNHPRGRSRPHRLDTSNEDCPKDMERFCRVGESYDDSFSHSYRDGNRSRHMKRIRDNESPLSSVSKSDSSDIRYQKLRSKRHKSTDEDDLTRPWMCEEEDLFAPRISHVERWAMPTWCHMFNSTLIGAARVWFDELHPESINSYKDLKAAFLAYFMQQKKYVKDPVEIHNIKQKDGETIEDFMKRFKVETGCMKGAPECMCISGFMHGVNNPELTKSLNEHVPKTMKEMMITTTAFKGGEAAAASKKKGHTSWKAHDQSKSQTLEKRSEFRVHPREGRGSNRFTPLTRTPKEILVAEASKFQPPPPMVTPVEKRSSNKFCDFHNDKGHSTDECSSMEILYEHCFNRLRPEIKNQMVSATTSLTGFSGEAIWPLGQLRLLVTIGDADHSTRAWMNFMIVRSLSPYNGIIGRPGIREIQAVPSTAHGMLKFPVEGGIVTICRVPRSVAKHRLNIPEGNSPVQQKKRGQAPERAKAIQAEVQKLVEAGIMREDCYPLPEIDWKVESLCGYPFKCFLDAYKGYHQIQLAKPDEEKTAFHTGQGVSALRTLAPHTIG